MERKFISDMLSIIIPDMLKNFSEESKFKIYLTLLSLVGLGFILIVTHRYGAGVSSDAARNLATAESLLQGKGFVDMLGGPFVLWPPLYPLLLAALSWLTKLSVFQAGWILNVILYPLNLWLCGWLFYLIFKEKSLYAIIGALAVLFSRSTLRIYANIASEPLFVTFMLIFFFAAARYLKDDFAFDVMADVYLGGIGDPSALSRRDPDRRGRTCRSFQGWMAGIASIDSSRADSGSAHRGCGAYSTIFRSAADCLVRATSERCCRLKTSISR